MRPDDEPSFSLARIECRLFHLIYWLWPMRALTFETPFTTARKERIKGWFFFNWIRWSASFPSLLTWLTSESFWMSCTAPSYFFFVSFRNHQCPFWNHCFNKQQIMRRRLQNKRASQPPPWTPTRVLMRSMTPNEQSLTRFANAASLFSLHSICRDSKYHRYDFEFLEQSPVNNKLANDTSLFMRHSTRRKTRM